MADREDGGNHSADEADGEEAPLGDVVDAVERGRKTTGEPPEEWARLEEAADEYDSGEVWDRLTSEGVSEGARTVETTARSGASGTAGFGLRTGPAAEAISDAGKTVHAVAAAILLLVAAGLYVTVTAGVLPAHLWVLSIPFLAAGLFLLVPVAAYLLGIWEPTQLAMEREGDGTTDTGDLPDVDTLDLE